MALDASSLRKIVYKTVEDTATISAAQAKLVEFSGDFAADIFVAAGDYKFSVELSSEGRYSLSMIDFGSGTSKFYVATDGTSVYIKRTNSSDVAENIGAVTVRKGIRFGEIEDAAIASDSTSGLTWVQVDKTYSTQLESLTVDGNFNLGSDLDVNGGDITTTQTTFNLINANATTLNIGGAATAINMAASNGTVNINSTTNSTSTTTGALVVDGGIGVANNAYIGSNANVAGTLSVTGNAGIGQAAGTEKLEVTGNAKISGDLAVNGGDITTTSTTLNIGYTGSNAQTINIGNVQAGSAQSSTLNLGYTGSVSEGYNTQTIKIGNNVATVNIPGNLVVAGTTTYAGSASYRNIVVDGDLTSATFPLEIRDTNPAQTVFSVGYNGSTYIRGDLQVVGTSALAAVTGTTGSFSGNVNAANVYVGSAITGYTGSFTNNVNVGNSLSVVGDSTLTGDLAVNGGDITTSSQTLNIGYTGSLFSTTNIANASGYIGSKTINIGTAAGSSRTDVNIGYTGSGTTTINSPLAIVSGSLNVTGDLTISGSTTTINTTELLVSDSTVTLNSGYTGTNPSVNAGIEVERGDLNNSSIIWNEGSDKWQFNDGSATYDFVKAGDLPTGFTIAANATDGIFDITGTSGTNSVTYAVAPYASKTTGGFDSGSTNPDGTTRLNWNGNLWATTLYSGGYEVLTTNDIGAAASITLDSLTSNTIDVGLIYAENGYTGSAGAPSYSFSGDSDTGMYSDTGDTIQFSTAGTERLEISSSGLTVNGGLTLSTDLTVANGGTGASSFTSNGVLYGANTSAISATSAGTTGDLLSAVTSSAPTWRRVAKQYTNTSADLTFGNGAGGGWIASTSHTVTDLAPNKYYHIRFIGAYDKNAAGGTAAKVGMSCAITGGTGMAVNGKLYIKKDSGDGADEIVSSLTTATSAGDAANTVETPEEVTAYSDLPLGMEAVLYTGTSGTVTVTMNFRHPFGATSGWFIRINRHSALVVTELV